MKYNVLTIAPFEKQFKRLGKKYPSLKNEISELIRDLKTTPDIGTPLGNDCYKIRLGIASKGKGKSGGARVLTYFAIADDAIYLLSIYDKAEQSTIGEKELLRLLELTK